MANKKPYFIQINGTKIVKNETQTKVASLESAVIEGKKFPDWQAAYSFADQKARSLKIEYNWHQYNVTVVECVPVKKAVYGLHRNEINKMLLPVFDKEWQGIMNNPVVLSVKDRLEDNDCRLLHEVLRSFIRKHSPEFVQYEREVRASDNVDFEQAMKDFVEEYYIAHLPGLESESATKVQ